MLLNTFTVNGLCIVLSRMNIDCGLVALATTSCMPWGMYTCEIVVDWQDFALGGGGGGGGAGW